MSSVNSGSRSPGTGPLKVAEGAPAQIEAVSLAQVVADALDGTPIDGAGGAEQRADDLAGTLRLSNLDIDGAATLPVEAEVARTGRVPPQAFARELVAREVVAADPRPAPAAVGAAVARAVSNAVSKEVQAVRKATSGLRSATQALATERRAEAVIKRLNLGVTPALNGGPLAGPVPAPGLRESLPEVPGTRLARVAAMAPDARAAYAKLPEADRLKVDKLFQAVEGGTRPSSALALAGLNKMLSGGTLAATDSQGVALLDRLSARVGQPVPAMLAPSGTTGDAPLGEIIAAIAFPGEIFQGDDTSTCVAASLETVLCKTAPAEYGRIATGLIFDGKVQLAGGQELLLSRSELGREDDGRPLAQQLIQGSLRDHGLGLLPYPPDEQTTAAEPEIGRGRYARRATYGEGSLAPATPAGGAPGGEGAHLDGLWPGQASDSGGYGYAKGQGNSQGDGQGDGSGAKVGRGGSGELHWPGGAGSGRLRAPAGVDRGLTAFQASQLFEQVVGNPAVPFEVAPSNVDSAMVMLQDAVSTMGAVSVGVRGVDDLGNPTFHQVTVVGLQDGNVQLADSGAGRQLSIPVDEFKKDLSSVIVPASFIRVAAQKLDTKAISSGMDPAIWLLQMLHSLGRRPRSGRLRRIWTRQIQAINALIRFKRFHDERALRFLESRLKSLARALELLGGADGVVSP